MDAAPARTLPIAAAIAVVLRGERMLLVRRSHRPDAGRWGFPGGTAKSSFTASSKRPSCASVCAMLIWILGSFPESSYAFLSSPSASVNRDISVRIDAR